MPPGTHPCCRHPGESRDPAAPQRSEGETCPPRRARPFRAPRAAGSRGLRGCAACPGMTKAGRANARCFPTIPLWALPKPQSHQPITKITTRISRLTSAPCQTLPVPSPGGSLGRRSAAAAGADGAGATRSQTPRGRLPRGCEVEPGGRPDGRGGGADTRTGPGDGRCHPCPPCAEGPLVNSEAHGPRMWKPVRAERPTFAETV